MHPFAVDLKRGLCSWRFWLAVLICASVYWLGSLQELGSSDALYILDASVTFSAFYHLFPIAAVLPLSCSFLEDTKSGYAKFILQRVTIRRYMLLRFLAATLLGALATILGMLFFFFFLLPITHPLTTMPQLHETQVVHAYMEDIVKNGQRGLYIAFFASLQGLSGFMWSSIGIALSALAGNAQLVYLSVVLSMEVLARLLFALGFHHIILYAIGALDIASRAQLFAQASSIFLSISLLAFLTFYFLEKRRLQNV